MYHAQITRYDLTYAVNQIVRVMSKSPKTHMRATKLLLLYPVGSIDLNITYQRRGFKLTAFSDANWDNNPDNGKPISSYITMLVNAPVSFKVGMQTLTAQSMMEAELVAGALAAKEVVH